MPPRATRSKKPKAEEEAAAAADAVQTKAVPPRNPDEQRRVFILPKELDDAARIVTLESSATGQLRRCLYCPTNGLYEFTNMCATEPASWLLDGVDSQSYVLEKPELFVATPLDAVFLLAPLFASDGPNASMFRVEDDHFEALALKSPRVGQLLRRNKDFRKLLLKCVSTVAQVREVGDETLYKLDLPKFASVIRAKSDVAAGLLPPSMQTALVKAPLAMPLIASREEEEQAGQNEPSEQVLGQQRQAVARQFILEAYIPEGLRPALETAIKADTDSVALLEWQAKVLEARRAALATTNANVARKHAIQPEDDDYERQQERAAKKQKLLEEEARKKTQSRGVKALAKVNVAGMKTLGNWFAAKPKA